MKQKTGKLTVITVLLLTVCIAAGAMGLPRLLGESISIPEAAEPALPGTALWGRYGRAAAGGFQGGKPGGRSG